MAQTVKVVYIGGYSRSGSTLLSLLLNQMDGLVSVGELWDIWQRCLVENQLTGTGAPFRQCGFWSRVIEEAYGGFDAIDTQEMQTLRNSIQGKQRLPQLIFPAMRTRHFRTGLREYTAVLERLYHAIQAVSGCRAIVDSSKVPHYALLLGEIPSIDLHIVHLVRDSRATAYSWQRKKLRPEIHWRKQYMDRYSLVRSSLEWDVMNSLFRFVNRRRVSYTVLRYEDLVEDPRAALGRIAAAIGEAEIEVPHFHDNAFQMKPNLTVSGNPDRFKQGMVKIRPDLEWQKKMQSQQKAAVTLLTWPLLARYGYLSPRSPVKIRYQPAEETSAQNLDVALDN